jgi:hypothetical protein
MLTSHRPGATRAGLLVLAAIGVVLLGLLPSAVQAVRESAARVSCGNNLKLVTMAAHDANGTYGFLPSNPDTLNDRYGTTQDHLQPFLE